ncbi:MAG: SH3 domain-containing protein [Nitrospirae bacterium]|nr:MAG: SH3 domain-containing protein [Nitrospirota bacterium]
MENRKSIIVYLSIMFLLIAIPAAYGMDSRLWVISAGAKLKADRRASSPTIERLPIGTELKVISSVRKWYKVVTPSGRSGWIYAGKVSKRPPKRGSGGLFGSFGGSGIKLSAADTSRSIRGLSPEAKEYARATATPLVYENALNEVLSMRITGREVEAFLKEGKIGEYAY